MIEQKPEQPRDDGSVMMSAHALCPSDLSHPQKMQWMAQYFRENTGAAQKVAVEGLPEPVAYQFRERPLWDKKRGFTEWQPCDKDYHENLLRVNVLHDWEYETRALVRIDAVEPLVSGLRAELERLQCDEQAFDGIVKMLDDLSTRNTELLGLLRNLDEAWNDHAGRSRFGECMRQVETTLAADEGRGDG